MNESGLFFAILVFSHIREKYTANMFFGTGVFVGFVVVLFAGSVRTQTDSKFCYIYVMNEWLVFETECLQKFQINTG